MKFLKLFSLGLLVSFLIACVKDDSSSSGTTIPAEAIPQGTYDVIRYQAMGNCQDDNLEDLNPCTTIEGSEFCVDGTVEVLLDEMDLNGLVITAETPFGQINVSVAAVSQGYDQTGRGPLNELIVKDLGGDRYSFEAEDKEDCFAVITIKRN